MNFDGQTVVESGLVPGERVVTDGQLQLVTGTKVEERRNTDPGLVPGTPDKPRGTP